MKTVTTLAELRGARAALPGTVGFVPTMGYLHAGHISLVNLAKQQCQSVVVSIFVNPAQFGPNEDLSAYPRDIPRDLQMLQDAGVDLVWLPTPEVMYPPGFQTWIDLETITQPLEGGMRPGHFRGVATVVAKLFNAVQPDKAYFGQKDAQQVVVVQRMALDLNFALKIVVGPTQREPDGLALSSRNKYLNEAERMAAPVLHRALQAAQAAYAAGERSGAALRNLMQSTIEHEPLARVQYLSCAHPLTLQELDTITDGALLSMAVYFGKTRLIDNIILN